MEYSVHRGEEGVWIVTVWDDDSDILFRVYHCRNRQEAERIAQSMSNRTELYVAAQYITADHDSFHTGDIRSGGDVWTGVMRVVALRTRQRDMARWARKYTLRHTDYAISWTNAGEMHKWGINHILEGGK